MKFEMFDVMTSEFLAEGSTGLEACPITPAAPPTVCCGHASKSEPLLGPIDLAGFGAS